MLRLFMNGDLFWSADPRDNPSIDYAIFSLKSSHKIDDIDTMSFTILITHPLYSKIIEKRTTFLLHDEEVLFLGKVVNIQRTYDFRVEIQCEEWIGATKDDVFSPGLLSSELSASGATNYDTVDEVLTLIINHLNQKKTFYAGINTAWPNFPNIAKGYTNYTGEAKEIQEFDIGCKTMYDVLYSELIGKCGGFVRGRVNGSLNYSQNSSSDGYRSVTGYTIKKVRLDYLSSETDYQINPENGLIEELEDPDSDVTDIDIDPSTIDFVIENTVPAEYIAQDPTTGRDVFQFTVDIPAYGREPTDDDDLPPAEDDDMPSDTSSSSERIADGSTIATYLTWVDTENTGAGGDIKDLYTLFYVNVEFISNGGNNVVHIDGSIDEFVLNLKDSNGFIHAFDLASGRNYITIDDLDIVYDSVLVDESNYEEITVGSIQHKYRSDVDSDAYFRVTVALIENK